MPTPVTHQPERQRFVLVEDGAEALLEYRMLAPDVIDFVHTWTPRLPARSRPGRTTGRSRRRLRPRARLARHRQLQLCGGVAAKARRLSRPRSYIRSASDVVSAANRIDSVTVAREIRCAVTYGARRRGEAASPRERQLATSPVASRDRFARCCSAHPARTRARCSALPLVAPDHHILGVDDGLARAWRRRRCPRRHLPGEDRLAPAQTCPGHNATMAVTPSNAAPTKKPNTSNDNAATRARPISHTSTRGDALTPRNRPDSRRRFKVPLHVCDNCVRASVPTSRFKRGEAG